MHKTGVFERFCLNLCQFVRRLWRKLRMSNFSIQLASLQKSENCGIKARFSVQKQKFLSDSAWICANLWENCEENCRRRLQYSTYLQKSKKCWIEAQSAVQKTGVFENFCLNFVQFCEKIADVDFSIQHVYRKRKMLNLSTICSAKYMRFWAFLLEFVLYCEKIADVNINPYST